MSRILLPPGTLWDRVVHRSEQALAAGALRPIATTPRPVSDGGMRFVVRVAENLRRKAEEKKRKAPDFNPFLPPEPELTVAEIADTHLAVLNKFNVVEHHLLVITRAFEEQESLLTRADLLALWACLAEYDALGFYNGGTVAGASQRHKHLQLIPLPPDGLPVEALIGWTGAPEGVTRLATLPFHHRFAPLPPGMAEQPAQAADTTLALYRSMLDALGIGRDNGRQGAPYNLLLTRRWLMLVPRSREHCAGISVNAMGFAGSLFVRDAQELERLVRTGPMTVLREVA